MMIASFLAPTHSTLGLIKTQELVTIQVRAPILMASRQMPLEHLLQMLYLSLDLRDPLPHHGSTV